MGSGLGEAAVWTQLGLASQDAGREENKQRTGFLTRMRTLRPFHHFLCASPRGQAGAWADRTAGRVGRLFKKEQGGTAWGEVPGVLLTCCK